VRQAWKGESDLAGPVLREARLDGPLGERTMITWLLQWNPREALPALESSRTDWVMGQYNALPKALLLADAHQALGDEARALEEYETARLALESEAAGNPGGTGAKAREAAA